LAKSVKVHDDTHATLKRLKREMRKESIDAVIRDVVRKATGSQVGEKRGGEASLSTYVEE
jgi:predicted CopG family antitoxin